mgnify:CR=1 FL=1
MGRKILAIGSLLVIAGVALVLWRARQSHINASVSPKASFADPTGGKPQPISPDSYQESRGRVAAAWSAYWNTGSSAAMELFQKEQSEHPNGYYSRGYNESVMKALPAYDKALKELQEQFHSELSQTERYEIYLKVYELSKKFYDENGLDTEASGPAYGPEFFDAEKKLEAFELPAANKLIRDWTQYDSCTDAGTAGKAEGQLTVFLDKFPDSPHKKQISDLLDYYKSGSVICGHKKTIQ